MPDLKCPKFAKIMDFRIFRMPGLKCTQIVEMMEFDFSGDPRNRRRPGYTRNDFDNCWTIFGKS